MKINYGTVKETQTIDDDGSTKTLIKHYREGKAVQRTRYEIRKRVRNHIEELAEYGRFRQEHTGSVETRVEMPKNYDGSFYYVVLCWEE